MANTIRIPVPDVAYARVSLPEIDITDNPYEAVEGAAAGIAGELVEREARNDEEFLSRAVADLNDTAANHVTDSMRNGAVGPGYTTSLNDALEARFKYWESQTDKPRVREALRQRYAGIRPQMLDLGLRTEADGRAQGAVDTTAATMQGLAQVAYYRPDQIGDVRERARDLREKYPEYGPAFDRQEQLINEAYLRGLIATNPKLALETLRSRKGYAEEDLGIPEPLREVLEHEAELATEAEIDGQTAAQEQDRIGLSLNTAAALAAARFDTGIPNDVYQPVRDAYKVDPKTGNRLEIQVDEAHAVALRRAERHNSVARALVEGRAVKWDAERLESLDTYIDTVANDGSGEATANERRVRMAIIAGVTPPQMQGHILKSLRATDPATRTGGLRMLQRLEENDETGGLTAWLPADQRATAYRFAALTAAGYADAEALQHLDAAKSANPSLEEARRHHFDTYARIDDLIDSAGRAYNVEPEGIADNDMQTLEYHPGRDGTSRRTQEYRPDRDTVGWQEVVQRGPRREIKSEHVGTDTLKDDNGVPFPVDLHALRTDAGRPFFAQKNRSGDPYRRTNCFGFVLLDGQFWLERSEAAIIMHDEYDRVDVPKVGDVVLYFEIDGNRRELVHAAKVVSVTDGPGGPRIRVVGKRGTLDADGIETDLDKQWPGEDLKRKDPRYRNRTVRPRYFRRR